MNTPRVIPVRDLPESILDHRATIWWGNLLLLFIETTMFALLVASYLYVRRNFTAWPPIHVNGAVGVRDPVPDLGVPTLNLFVLLISCAPMLLADRMALRLHCRAVEIGLLLTIVIGGVAIWLRWHEFSAIHFRWDDNAYASIVWTTTGLHLLHLIVGTLENVTLFAWVTQKGLDQKHARDVRVGAVYWYWIAGIWVPLYALMFLGPRYF